jgi:hypothetical protein
VVFRPGPIAYCVEAIPGATGTILIERSEDNGATFNQQPIGTVATVNSVSGNGSLATQIRVTAGTVAGAAVLMNLSNPQVGGGGPEFLLNGVPYTVQATLTTELTLLSIRFPPGLLKPNFRLEVDYALVCTNNANVKTLRAYFGNSVEAALEGGTIVATQVATSSGGQMTRLVITGRGNGTTIDAQGIGVSGEGWGLNTTAPISVAASAVYAGAAAVEQALVLSYQKATAADVLTLQSVLARLYQ